MPCGTKFERGGPRYLTMTPGRTYDRLLLAAHKRSKPTRRPLDPRVVRAVDVVLELGLELAGGWTLYRGARAGVAIEVEVLEDGEGQVELSAFRPGARLPDGTPLGTIRERVDAGELELTISQLLRSTSLARATKNPTAPKETR